ncbi:DUF1643 domain-containing protein [Candidatus Pacearchaeota archaeon]|nr:DUF1643 domain-containing protein [Candidatus Pacearchaeota archaeon]
MKKKSTISKCGKYRYSLSRIWDNEKETVTFICLNPLSEEKEIDPTTIKRLISFAKSWGYGGFYMGNLFALRETDFNVLKKNLDPVGDYNDQWISKLAWKSKIVVAAWGVRGNFKQRDEYVKKLIGNKLHYLELSKDGIPKHPVFLKKDLKPISFLEAG